MPKTMCKQGSRVHQEEAVKFVCKKCGLGATKKKQLCKPATANDK